ncbi:MAG: RNA-dependent RNA polymerase [Hangzhou nephotettix cincticeps phenuivirus 1]|nr:MAG: RNA-dependent RNA polymerase [Hangzhou nephotettix cincticeps phenuivirus 1]
MDIYGNIRQEHGLLDFRPPGVYHRKEPEVQDSSFGLIPMHEYVTVNILDDQVNWRLTLPEDLEGLTSVRSSTSATMIDRYAEYKLRHEYVAEALSVAKTDVRLDNIFGAMGDAFDGLTPDFYVTDYLGIIHIVELGTDRHPEPRHWKGSYSDKLFKYREPLISRATERVVTLTPVIVTQTSVVSGVKLPQKLVDELCFRMLVAVAIEDNAKEQGFQLVRGEEMKKVDQIAQDIRLMLESVGPNWPKPDPNQISITEDFYDKIFGASDKKELMKDFVAARSITLKEEKRQKPADEVIGKYISELQEEPRKYQIKPTCIMPLVSVKHSSGSGIKYNAVVSGDAPDYMKKLWDEALSKASKSDCPEGWSIDRLMKEAYEEDKKKIEAFEKERLSSRGKHKVVNLSRVLTTSVVKQLQRDGLYGKAAKDDPDNKVRRIFQKTPFHWDTELSDIDQFLKNKELYENLHHLPPCQEAPMMLVEWAHNLSSNKHFDLDIVKEWMSTRWFHSTDLMTDIATEICLSLKQNHNSTEMLVKRLKNYNAYLLIKTTNSTSHVFFSIFFPDKSDVEWSAPLPFRQMRTASKGLMTEFVSIKRDKLANFLNASSRLLTLAAFWCDFYGVSSMSVKDFVKIDDAVAMLNLSMLISLENKAETEESITQTRYMYMEVFLSTQSRKRPNPFKILPKLTKIPRSRLNLWCIKRIIGGFKAMTDHQPMRLPIERSDAEAGDDVMPGDKWRGLINIYTGNVINSATAVVNLMYLGYLKDKNQEADGNSEWSLVEKILEEECKIKHDNRSMQYGVPLDELPKGKGFSLNAVIHGCELMEQRLRKSKGPEWKKTLTRDITLSLARHLSHEIATLKAASSIKHEEVRETATIKDQENVRRVKVIEAIAINKDRYGMNPFLNFLPILESVEKKAKGVVCDLFKKQQHGGTREIYVLNSDSRILQLFVETVARELCSNFEEETLTHPENKLKKLDTHKINACRIAKKRMSVFADFCSSSDKTRWNQNFIMTAMCVPLLRMTEELFHQPIIRVLNLWANKYIKLPPTVVKLLMNKKHLSSETYQHLYNKFHDLTKGDTVEQRLVAKPKSPFMNLTSGMMQGILHYTSSLLHVSFLSSSKNLAMSYLKCAHNKKGVRFMMTSVCSSDDSATILTAFSQKNASEFEREDLAAFLDCDIILNTLTTFCRLYCMVESVKSTISLYDYVEFNSEFIFKNTIAMPTIKMVAACLTISESESFSRRQYELYNLISSLSSAGFPHLNTYFCQIAQALLHYKSMGSATSPLFPLLADRLTIFPDIAHGFFLLDKDILAGVAGLSFARWKSIQNNTLIRAGNLLHYSEEADVALDGTLVDSLTVRHGEHRRWYKLLDRIVEGREIPSRPTYDKMSNKEKTQVNKELLKERMDMINSKPEVLYRHPENEKELTLKLLAKALNAGVSRSLAKGNPLTQAFASSSYTLYAHCFTRVSTHKQVTEERVDKLEKTVKKVSLLQSLEDRTSQAESIVNKGLESLDMEYAFPLHHCYEEIDQVCKGFDESTYIRTHEMRQKKNFITLHPRLEKLPISLLQMVGHKWFGFNLKVSSSMVKRSWAAYQEKFRWLRDTHTETLKESPFERHSDLHSFISAQSQAKRTYLHVGPSVQSERFSHQILNLIKKSSLRNHLLEPTRGLDPREQLRAAGLVGMSGSLMREKYESELSLALAIPVYDKRVDHVTRTLEKIADLRPSTMDWISLPKWELDVGLIALFHTKKISAEDLNDALRIKGMGIRISFLTCQKKHVTQSGATIWKGPGDCIVSAEGIVMRLSLMDDRVTLVKCNHTDKLRLRPDLLIDVFGRLNSRADTSAYRFGFNIEYKFTGTQFVPPSGAGVPIVSDDSDWFSQTDSEDLKVCITSGAISVTSGDDRPIPVIRFQMKPWACSVVQSDLEPEKDIWKAWVSFKPVAVRSAFNFLRSVESKLREESRLERRKLEMVQGWISQSLQSRLKTKGIGFTTIDALVSIPTTTDDGLIGDDEFQDILEEFAFDDDNLSELVTAFGETIVAHQNDYIDEDDPNFVEEWRNIDFDALLNYEEARSPFRTVISNWADIDYDIHASVLGRESKDMYPLHPLWDEFISNVLSMVDSKWFSKVLQGVKPAHEEKLATMLMKVLDIKESGIEKGLWDRFARDSPEDDGQLN